MHIHTGWVLYSGVKPNGQIEECLGLKSCTRRSELSNSKACHLFFHEFMAFSMNENMIKHENNTKKYSYQHLHAFHGARSIVNLQDGSDSNRNEPHQRCCAGTWRDVQDGRLGDEDSGGVARLQWESSRDLDCYQMWRQTYIES